MTVVYSKTGTNVTDEIDRSITDLFNLTESLEETASYADAIAKDYDVDVDTIRMRMRELYDKRKPFPRYFIRRQESSTGIYMVATGTNDVHELTPAGVEAPRAIALSDCIDYVRSGTWCEIPEYVAKQLKQCLIEKSEKTQTMSSLPSKSGRDKAE